ncbi:MAG: 4-carboxy-4-hydroxy-2-oxoadipate aldolase/oxaloacetate decarboxylase [Anaerolineae bacterium]|nr:4-carboxy-4-hydroxy-2-oxoadipate aldolase/oxaloacetate decarboxylase [Anaerolineae bacterium]
MTDQTDAFKRLAEHSAATIHEAIGKQGALPSALKPISPAMKLAGRAYTIDSMPGDNYLLHRAVANAEPGDVLVARMSGYFEAGYWGEILSVAAMERGIAGLVIDGCVRDADAIERLGFPVFCRGLCIRGTTKHGDGSLNCPITINEVTIAPGDFVLGDRDGIVVVPAARVAEAAEKSEARVGKENSTFAQLRSGKTTLEIYGWK